MLLEDLMNVLKLVCMLQSLFYQYFLVEEITFGMPSSDSLQIETQLNNFPA